MTLPQRLVYQLIRSGRATSQSDIARHLRMPGNTVHGLMGRMAEAGLICPGRKERRGRGRPIQHYRVRRDGTVLAVRWLGSVWQAGVFSGESARGQIQTRQSPLVTDLDQALEALRGLRDAALAAAQLEMGDVTGAVVAINAVRGEGGYPLSSSVLPWLREVGDAPFSQALGCETQLQLACGAVVPELRARMSEGVRSLTILNIGDGVSAHGMSLDEEWGGEHAWRGEVGHMVVEPRGPMCGCGHRGCLEAVASGPAVLRRVKADVEAGVRTALSAAVLSGGVQASPGSLFDELERVEGEDAYAAGVVEDFVDRVAWAVSAVVNMAGPDVIVLSGYTLEERETWRQRILARARDMVLFGEEEEMRVEYPRLGAEEYLAELSLTYDFHAGDAAAQRA